MFCKKCGKEITDGSVKCEFCGQDFKGDIEKALKNKFSCIKQKKNLLFLIGIVVVVAIVVLLVSLLRTTTPNTEQLKKDFISQILQNDEYTISDFDVAFETDGKDDYYNAIVDVIYDNTKTEHHRQYEFVYKKYDEWVLSEINQYKEDSWTKQPLNSPSISDYTEQCKKELSEVDYNIFKPLGEKTSIDLGTGKAVFYFNVKTNAPVGSVSGDFKFEFKYNFNEEQWELCDISATENYVIETNFLQTWEGSGLPDISNWYTGYDAESFVFEITQHEGTKAQATLTFKNNKYILSGTINNDLEKNMLENDNYSSKYASIYFSDDSNKIHITGDIYDSGLLQAEIDTDYKPGGVSMYGNIALKDMYSIVMHLK